MSNKKKDFDTHKEGWFFQPFIRIVVIVVIVLYALLVLWRRYNQNSVSDPLSEWQGHLLSCPGQLKKFNGDVFNYLRIIWLQDDLDTRASKLRSQKWSRYHLRGSDWKVNPFLKGSGDCAKSCSNRQKSPFFSKAGETAILNCSFYLHSDNLYSVKWYKVLYNFSFFYRNWVQLLP